MASALVVITCIAAFALAAGAARPGGGDGGGGTTTAPFELTGNVEGLWPGGSQPFMVKIENPYRFDIVVLTVAVTVGPTAPTSCPSSVLSVGTLPGEVLVRARGEAVIELTASLDSSAPDSCQGATWPLTYTASARRA